jgi:hypothetical protein
MSRAEQIVALVRDHWPDEYDAAGKSKVDNIAAAVVAGQEVNLITTSAGRSFDLLETLKLILVIAQLAKTSLDLIEVVRNSGAQPQAEQIREEAIQRLPPAEREKLDSQKCERMIEDAVQKAAGKAEPPNVGPLPPSKPE